MSETSGHERRQHPRVEARIPVRISTIEPERDPRSGRSCFRASQEVSANLSHGGAFVKTAEPLSRGRRLLVEFSLPDGSPMETIGRVAWSKRTTAPDAGAVEYGVGVEFIAGASEQLEALDAYIRKLTDT